MTEFLLILNPTALRTAKTLQSFGLSECNRVKVPNLKIAEVGNSVDPDEAAHNNHLIWIYTACPLVFEFSI